MIQKHKVTVGIKQAKYNVNQHLAWKSHIEYMATKISKTKGILCRIRFYVNQPLLKILYNSLIYPFLHYANIVWANNYPTRLDKLLKLQKKALRVITFSSYKAPFRPLFQKSIESIKH